MMALGKGHYSRDGSASCDCPVLWLGSLRVILLDGFSLRGKPAGRTLPVGRPRGTLLRQMDRHFAGVGGWVVWKPREDGHQETEGVPLEGRCSNALPWRMLPLTD